MCYLISFTTPLLNFLGDDWSLAGSTIKIGYGSKSSDTKDERKIAVFINKAQTLTSPMSDLNLENSRKAYDFVARSTLCKLNSGIE